MVHPNSLKNLKPVKPGEVRNPNGRPPGIKYISEIMRELLSEDRVQELIREQILKQIEEPDSQEQIRKMIAELRDTTEGKPKQSIEVEAKADMNIQLDGDIPVKGK